jgi:hypothetical protein
MAVTAASRPSRGHRQPWSRTLAALIGGLAATLALTVALAAWAPLDPSSRRALAVLLAFPTWVAAALYAFLVRRAAWAWLGLIAITLAAALAASLA